MDVLRNVRMPTEGQIRANDVNRIGSWEYPNRSGLVDSKEQMLWGLQNLRTQLAGRPMGEIQEYLKTIGMPAQYAQELMNGDLANLAGIANLDESATYRGLEDKFGIDQVMPSEFVGGYPNLPSQNRGVPDTGGGAGGGGYGDDMYRYPDPTTEDTRGLYGEPQITDAYGRTALPSDFANRAREANASAPPRKRSTYYDNPTGGYYMSGPEGGGPTRGIYQEGQNYRNLQPLFDEELYAR